MPNINKVIYGNTTLVDLTDTTAVASDVASGKYFYTANGIKALGTAPTGAGISVVTTQDVNNGDIITITAEPIYPYNPFGEQAELLTTYPKQTFILKDTDFNTWTPSTTAKAIQATATLGTWSIDLANYEYFTKFIAEAKINYVDGTTKKAAVVRQVTETYQYIFRRPGSVASLGSLTNDTNICSTITTPGLADYYNSSGNRAIGWTASYGFYLGATAHTFASSTNTSTTLTIKRPALNARCSTTYLSTTMGGKVDKETSTIDCWGELYRCKKGCFGRSIFNDLISTYNA